MDLAHPISSVIPSAHGAVLAVLARTDEPLSGRRLAELTDGSVGQWRASQILGQLTEAGVVTCEHHPPSKLYRLNRDHVAAPGILALADMWATLLRRMRDELAGWEIAPIAACLFGSAARGETSPDSDLDVLLVRADAGVKGTNEARWNDQVDRLVELVRLWSGNTCEVLELSTSELDAAVARDDRLVRDLRRDAVALTGADIRTMLRRRRSA